MPATWIRTPPGGRKPHTLRWKWAEEVISAFGTIPSATTRCSP